MLDILVVDDEKTIRDGIARLVLDAGYNVLETASSGTNALELLSKKHVDVVITDIKMPDMNGLQLSKTIYDKYPSTKVIVLTGYADFEYARQAIKYSVVDFILKPTSKDDLKKAILKAHKKINQSSFKLFNENTVFNDLYYNKVDEKSIENFEYNDFLTCLCYVENDCVGFKHKIAQKIANVYFVDINKTKFYAIVSKQDKEALFLLVLDENMLEEGDIHMGVSNICKDLFQFKKSTYEAESALKFAFYDNNQSIIEYCDIPKTKENVLEECVRLLDLIKKSISNCDSAESTQNTRNLVQYMKKEQIAYQDVKSIFNIFYNFCMSTVYNYSLLEKMDKNIDINQVLKNDDLDVVLEEIEKFIKDIIEFIGRNPGYMDNIVTTIKNYIDINYKEEISLDILAQKAHFSPSYLSKVFKKQIGQNISTYIQNVRVENAKKILKTTNHKTYEIAEMVGIDDPVYFSRIFKKHTGLKPKEFRENS